MRNIVLSIILVCTFSFSSRSQETNARMLLADSLSDCSEIQYAAMQLIPLYYQDGIVDTANRILNYWSNKCGTDETILRTKILWAIDAGKFSDDLFGNEVIQYLDDYQWLHNDTTGASLTAYYYYTPEFSLLKWYQTFTDSIALRALSYTDLSAEEVFFAKYYLHPNDSLFLLLTGKEYEGTKLRKIFNTPVLGEEPEWAETYTMGAGLWVPNDKLSLVGKHPLVSASLGLIRKRTTVSIGADLAMGYSKNKFDVLYQDLIYHQDNFMELGLHLDISRQILQYKRQQLYLSGGGGVEILNVLTVSSDNSSSGNDSKALSSPGLNFGATYICYLNARNYIGIKARYNFENFNNSGGTNLRGNSYTLTLEYGIGLNSWLNAKTTYLNNRISSFKR